METNKKIGLAVGVFIVILVAGIWFSSGDEAVVLEGDMVLYEDGEMRPYVSEPSGEVISTTYQCEDDEFFVTNYDIGANEITLETHDGLTYVLPQIVTEHGARYGTFDGSVVFSEADGAASVERDEMYIYSDCIPEVE